MGLELTRRTRGFWAAAGLLRARERTACVCAGPNLGAEHQSGWRQPEKGTFSQKNTSLLLDETPLALVNWKRGANLIPESLWGLSVAVTFISQPPRGRAGRSAAETGKLHSTDGCRY